MQELDKSTEIKTMVNSFGVIYKAVNRENGLVYIGATTKSLEARKIDHIQKAKNNNGSRFQEAITKYGIKAFHWKIIYEAISINDLAEKETFYINYYNSKNNGYNNDNGGGFQKNVYQYTHWGLMVMEHYSLNNASWSVRGNKKGISNACLGNNITYKGYYWSYSLVDENSLTKDKRIKSVIQLNLIGDKLEEYISVSDASEKTGISKTCISRCCRGEREKSGGFLWRYN